LTGIRAKGEFIPTITLKAKNVNKAKRQNMWKLVADSFHMRKSCRYLENPRITYLTICTLNYAAKK